MRITAAELQAKRAGKPIPRRENEVLRAIFAYLRTQPGIVAWRTNSGISTMQNKGGPIRHVRFGFKGIADIIGWRVYDDQDGGAGPCSDVGHCTGPHLARFLAVEAKGGAGELTREQRHFLDVVKKDGGIAIVARSVDDVVEGLRGAY